MSDLSEITNQAGEWLRGAGPDADIVISSRIRLARNLAGHQFVNRATRRERSEVLERCRDQILTASLTPGSANGGQRQEGDIPPPRQRSGASESGGKVMWLDLTDFSDTERMLLVERHLISRNHAEADGQDPRAVAIDPHETFSIMVNEEDHLRIQVLRSGKQLTEAYDRINQIDDLLEQKLSFAYARRWGYLTACPTNVGTGIRVSVMMHLPALKLTGEIEKMRRAARDMQLAVRGLFGEGSDALGDLYQISNQITLGKTEWEILDELENKVAPQIVAYEKQARQALLRDRPKLLEDKIWRAWGVLTHARVLTTEEALSLLSHLRMGVNLGVINTVDIPALNRLFLLTQPAHLQMMGGKQMDKRKRREARAEVVREALGG